MLLDFLLITEHGPVDHNHTFHHFSDLGIQFWVPIFDFIKEVVKITLDLLVCVQIFSDLPEVILVTDVGHNHIVLYVRYQSVDKFKVLNVLFGEKFVVYIVAYTVNVLLDKETLSIGEVMGMGHRVYKAKDPRSIIMEEFLLELSKKKGDTGNYDTLKEVETTFRARMEQKGKPIYPNVDFFSGAVYTLLGIPKILFTPIFAVSRVAGWLAHILEQRRDNRIYRPKSLYVGSDAREWVPLEKR